MDEFLARLRDAVALLKSWLAAWGIPWPTPEYLIGITLFGMGGVVLLALAQQRGKPKTRWIGLAMALYPYVVWNTVAVYVVGIVLSIAAAVCWWREGAKPE